ncbi:MAG: hypothetical protein AAGF12_20240 [Myxococcota bacterium]
MRSIAFVLASLTLLSACGDSTAEETDRLIERISLVDIEASPEQRRLQIRQLGELELKTSSLRELRDRCVEGNEALLEAEEIQDEAAAELAEVTANLGEDPIPREDSVRIEAAIQASTDALESARSLLTRCQDDVRRLEVERSVPR